MEERTDIVTIPLGRYNAIMETNTRHHLLREALFANVRFNYINENIDFYVSSDVIKALLPEDYNRKLEDLTKAYEEEHEKRRSEASNV